MKVSQRSFVFVFIFCWVIPHGRLLSGDSVFITHIQQTLTHLGNMLGPDCILSCVASLLIPHIFLFCFEVASISNGLFRFMRVLQSIRVNV